MPEAAERETAVLTWIDEGPHYVYSDNEGPHRGYLVTSFLTPGDTSPCRFNPNTGGGGEFLSDWTPGASTFTVRGPVTIRVFHDSDRLGGWWCWMDGPSATYTWSVGGTTLTLAPVGGHAACGIRGFIWAGTWTRVG